ncbi:MAG: trigger factor [Bacilli bacterium]|nr:trigger factor [Bacilli bacterium]
MKNVHTIDVELTKEEWSECLDKAFKKQSKEVKIDGFRKGTAPKDMFIKKFGIEVLYNDAVDEAINLKFGKAIVDSKLIPIIEPKIDIKKISDTNFAFTITVITKPEVKLGEYKNLKVKKETAKVTKEEIDEEIKNLRNQYAEIKPKTEGKIKAGDTAVIDFEGVVDGKVLDGGTGKNYPLEIGSNTFIPGFEDGLVDMCVNEEKELNLKFPENYTEELKNKDVTFKVKVVDIKERVLPEMNEDFFLDLGMEDVKSEADLKKHIEEEIKKHKEAHIEDEYVEACLDKALKNAKIEINEEIIDEEVHRMIHQFEEQLKMQGLNMEQYAAFTGMTHEKMHEQMEPEAKKRVGYRFLIDKVAETEKIEPTDKEVKEHLKKLASDYGTTEEEITKMYGDLEVVKYDLKMYKAIDVIKS